MKYYHGPAHEEPLEIDDDARENSREVVRRMLIWMADGKTLEERGLRASVALYCVRPDLIDHATLEAIGDIAGRTKQAVHQLAVSFRRTTGLGA